MHNPSAALYLAVPLTWYEGHSSPEAGPQQVRSHQLIKHWTDGEAFERSQRGLPHDKRWVMDLLYHFGQLDYDVCKSVSQWETSERGDLASDAMRAKYLKLPWDFEPWGRMVIFSEKEREIDFYHCYMNPSVFCTVSSKVVLFFFICHVAHHSCTYGYVFKWSPTRGSCVRLDLVHLGVPVFDNCVTNSSFDLNLDFD